MILTGPGQFLFRFTDPGNLDFASASASEGSFVRAWYDDELIEDVFIGPYSPHTWWVGNGLIGRKSPVPGAQLMLEVGAHVKVRIEGDLERIA